MATGIADDTIWPVSTLTPDEFGKIARVLRADVTPWWRFVIEPDHSDEPHWISGDAGLIFGTIVGGVPIAYDQSVPVMPMGTPYLAADAFVVHELLIAWFAGPRDGSKLRIFFEEGYGVMLRRGADFLDPCRARLIYPWDEFDRFGETCAEALALGWRGNDYSEFHAGTSPGDISQLAALIELTATEVFNAHRIIEVSIADSGRHS